MLRSTRQTEPVGTTLADVFLDYDDGDVVDVPSRSVNRDDIRKSSDWAFQGSFCSIATLLLGGGA
jgi:hypothetical protein